MVNRQNEPAKATAPASDRMYPCTPSSSRTNFCSKNGLAEAGVLFDIEGRSVSVMAE